MGKTSTSKDPSKVASKAAAASVNSAQAGIDQAATFHFQPIFHSHNAVMLLIDPVTGAIVDANEAAAKFYGYSQRKLKSLNIADINMLTPEQITVERLRALEHERNSFTFPHRLASGEKRTVEVHSTPVTHGDRTMLLSVIHDVSDRIQAEQQVRELSDRLILATKASRIGIFEYRFSEASMLWDSFMYQLYGLDPACGRDGQKVWEESIHPDDYEAAMSAVGDALAGSGDMHIEFRVIWPDGSWHYLKCHAEVVKDEHGVPVKMVGANWDLTERKKTEAGLLDRERRLSSIYETVADSVFLISVKDGTFTFESVNSAFLSTTGARREEVEGRAVSEFIPPESLPLVLSNYRRAIEEKKLVQWEETSTFPTGTQVGVVSVVPLFDEQGHCTNIVGSVHHITDRKRAEEAMTKSKAQLEGLTDSLPGIIFQFYARDDGKMGFHYLSRKTDAILGISRDVADPLEAFSSRLDPRDVSRFQNSVLEAVKGRTPWSFEGRFYQPSGTAVWLRGISSPEIRPGEVVFNGILLDITEQKHAQLALSESEERFRLIAEGAFDVIVASDEDRKITYVSPTIEEKFGYRPEELLGRSVADITPVAEHADLDDAFLAVAAGQKVAGKFLQVIRKDGTIADAEINAQPMFREGRVMGNLAIVRDITETRRLQDLESRAQRLETAGKIAGQVAHDFNNLLAPIIAYPEFIRPSLPEADPARSYLNAIETAANKIADINQELLTLSRRGHYTLEVLNLNPVVTQIVADLGQFPQTLVCTLDLSPELMNIRGGRAQICRALMNIIVNARDALRDIGEIKIKSENYYVDSEIVGFGKIPRGEYVKLTISDTGCGIPESVRQRIFDPFFTTKLADKKRGTGLGLSVVDSVVRDHDGYIDLVTREGQGTSFYLYFPVTRAADQRPASEEDPRGTERLLVVDDDDMQRTVTSELLNRLGYNVTCAESGETALELLGQSHYDLLILDMIMPGTIDGAETFRRSLAINPEVRAIIVSGFSETERVRVAQEFGAGPFVRKPLTRSSLARAVRQELDRAVTSMPSRT
jgi:PAS domain S-box-containing protein